MSDVSRFGFSGPRAGGHRHHAREPRSPLSASSRRGSSPRRTAELIVYTLLITGTRPPCRLARPQSVFPSAPSDATPPRARLGAGSVPVARVKLTARQVPIDEAPRARDALPVRHRRLAALSAPQPTAAFPELGATRHHRQTRRIHSIARTILAHAGITGWPERGAIRDFALTSSGTRSASAGAGRRSRRRIRRCSPG